ncbi:MAG: hypothetical protein L7S44_05155 [Flavobacteriaceae bacterium]|nr:hypothetical protein [Flavobacteriaceae bacterium]
MLEHIKNKFISDYEISWSFSISINEFFKEKNRYNYNSIIRENIAKKNTHGVYLISDSNSKTILYVGMSGQIKKSDDGKYKNCGYDIRKRLVSSRGKQKNGKTDISSSDYFKDKMNEEDIQSITITILKTNNKISPTYLESCILQYYFIETDTLPIWNNSF